MTNNNNPWAGLASYEDPSKSERKLKFCGRDNDIYDVTRLIDDNLLLILYGKSGIGKTSLLNAGVFPKLRLEQYLPVSIRLGILETNVSYQEVIISAVEKAIEEVHGSITVFNVVEEQADNQQTDHLWNYFARHRFFDAEQQPLFPVVVFDQFEEVLRNSSSKHIGTAQTLLNQLQYLIDESHALNDCIVDGKEYFYDFNFRFVISIREDELCLLEDNIDDLSLSMFRNCRYRLRPMKPEQARQVVLVPGESCIKTEDKEAIAVQVVKLAKQNNQNSIDTILLSLICSELYDIANQKQTIITKELIEQLGDNILSSFYEKSIHSVSLITVDYLESYLLTQSGFRNSIAMEDIIHQGIKKEDIEKLVNIHLLRIESYDGIERVEFIHDALCLMAKNNRDKRKEVNKRTSERFHNIGFFIDIALPLSILLSIIIPVWQVKGVSINIIYILILIIGCFIVFPYRHTKERNSLWFSLIQCCLFAGLLYVKIPFGEAVSKGDDSQFVSSLITSAVFIGIGGAWYWLHTIISIGFNKKRSLKEAIMYVVRLQVYKEHPQFKIILLVILFITSIILFAII